MRIEELYESQPTTMGNYQPEHDNRGTRKTTDTRKQVVTLGHLNKLRKYREFKEIEYAQVLKRKSIIYADNPKK